MVDTLWEDNPHLLVSLPGSLMLLSIREWDRLVDGCRERPESGDVYQTPSGGEVYLRHDMVEFCQRIDELELLARQQQKDIAEERRVPE
jgi:hypothetical protein